MKKNKRIIIIPIIILTVLNIFLVLKNNDNNIVEKNKVNKIERKEFAIYKQNANTKEYNITNDNEFPEVGYLLNETKTKCYGYNKEEIVTKPIQELTNGVINGKVTIESSKTIYCEIYFDIDNKVPEINTFEITGKTNTGEELTNGYTYENQDLPYQLEYIDEDVAQYCISNTVTCNEWKEIKEKTDTLTIDASDGEKTIYAYIKDKANNVSKVNQETITVDRTKPVVTTFTLTGTPDKGQSLSNPSTYTHTRNITYNATITEANIESYCVYENGGCSYENTTEKELKQKEYNLTESEGIKTLSIKVKDKAGNESDILSKNITLDLQNPTATISQKSVTTESITVTVGYTGNDISGIVQRQCKINNQNTWKDAEPSGECTISNLDNGTKLTDGTEYTIEARVKDGSGRKSAVVSQDITTKSNSAGKQILDKKPKGLSEEELGGMYRFVGQCDAANNGCDGIVDNFVCFGYETENQCKSDIANNEYLYRIIGITPKGEMKLIKNKPLAAKAVWHSDSWTDVPWGESDLCKSVNGKDFLESLSTNWQEKIEEHVWPDGVIPLLESADSFYEAESRFSGPVKKVGLQSLSDPSFAIEGGDVSPSWNSPNDWMNLAFSGRTFAGDCYEWTLIRHSSNTGFYLAWHVGCYGVSGARVSSAEYVRPVFYVSEGGILETAGRGTAGDPFILENSW